MSDNSKLYSRLASFRELGILGVLALVVLIAALRSPAFLTFQNLNNIALDIAILAIVAVGMMTVLLTGGIDISVGSGLGFCGMVVAILVVENPEMSPLVALLLGGVIGSILGSFNGFMIVKAQVNPIVTTLANLSLFRGLTFIVNFASAQGSWIPAHLFPESFKQLARGTTLFLPNLILIALIVYVVFYYVIRHTRLGRQLYAVGSNRRAASFAGIKVGLIRFVPFVFTGFLFGMGGVLWVSRYTAAQTDTGAGFEFTVITAVVVGGTNINGGSGTVLGVLLGSVLLGVIRNALNVAQISPFWELAINGFIILSAIVVDKVLLDKSTEALQRRKV